MERSLVVGMGEIGKAVKAIFNDAQTLDLERRAIEPPINIMHICFPYSAEFVDQVKAYANLYKPDHIIIYSTIAIGTTAQIPGAVHSPVEGRHPKLEESIRKMRRWLGCNQEAEGRYFRYLFHKRGISSIVVPDPAFTEFLKLRSTSKYGINLVWADYEKSVADDLGMDFNLIKDFDKDYNQLYQQLGMDWAQRYILDPPAGKIGGHCVVPNAHILDEQYPSELLEQIRKYDD